MKKLLLSLILGLIWKNSLAQLDRFTCDPLEDCTTIGVAGAVVPDPDNCENFYVCIDVSGEIIPSTNSVPCPDGEYFDQTLGSCKIEDTPGVCGPNVCSIRMCSSECPTEFTMITSVASRDNCSTYYVCLESSPVLVSCATNAPYFNGTTCVSDASECCDFCTAYCKTAGIQIVDPCDCTSYYLCFEVGPALPNLRFTCTPPGTYYDETSATCKDGPCSNICSNCNTQNSSTTTTTLSTDTTTTTLSTDTTTTTLSTDTTTTTLSTDTTTTTLSTDTTTTTLSADTTTTTPGNGCQSVESFTCPNDGNYAMCPFCTRDYFHCLDGVATVGRCSGNTVFNPIPEYPYCLDPSNCPYS